jgi:hypothetical protein
LSSVIKSYMTFCICVEKQSRNRERNCHGHHRGLHHGRWKRPRLSAGATSTPALPALAKEGGTCLFPGDREAEVGTFVFLITKVMSMSDKF